MSEGGIQKEVRQLLDDCIDSVVLLEVLLFLRAEPDRSWTVAEASSRLRVEANWLRERLDGLVAGGLLASSGQPPRYRFLPSTHRLAQTADALADAYAVRRMAVVDHILKRSRHLRGVPGEGKMPVEGDGDD